MKPTIIAGLLIVLFLTLGAQFTNSTLFQIFLGSWMKFALVVGGVVFAYLGSNIYEKLAGVLLFALGLGWVLDVIQF